MKPSATTNPFLDAVRRNSSIEFLSCLKQHRDKLKEIINLRYNNNGDTLLHWAECQYLINIAYQAICKPEHCELDHWLTNQVEKGRRYESSANADHLRHFYPEIIQNYREIIVTLISHGANEEIQNKQKRNPEQFARYTAMIGLIKQSKESRDIIQHTIANTAIPHTLFDEQLIPRPTPKIVPDQYRLCDTDKPKPVFDDAVMVTKPIGTGTADEYRALSRAGQDDRKSPEKLR